MASSESCSGESLERSQLETKHWGTQIGLSATVGLGKKTEVKSRGNPGWKCVWMDSQLSPES